MERSLQRTGVSVPRSPCQGQRGQCALLVQVYSLPPFPSRAGASPDPPATAHSPLRPRQAERSAHLPAAPANPSTARPSPAPRPSPQPQPEAAPQPGPTQAAPPAPHQPPCPARSHTHSPAAQPRHRLWLPSGRSAAHAAGAEWGRARSPREPPQLRLPRASPQERPVGGGDLRRDKRRMKARPDLRSPVVGRGPPLSAPLPTPQHPTPAPQQPAGPRAPQRAAEPPVPEGAEPAASPAWRCRGPPGPSAAPPEVRHGLPRSGGGRQLQHGLS